MMTAQAQCPQMIVGMPAQSIMKETNSNYEMKELYRALKVDTPAKEQCVVSIRFEDRRKLLNMPAIENTMEIINHHCPGLLLERGIGSKLQIEVCVGNTNRTKYSIKSESKMVYISLAEETIHQEYHVVHEFLHALGFEHEHQ